MNDDYLPPLPPLPPMPSDGVETPGPDQRVSIGNGPFGLAKGLRKEDLNIQLQEVKPCVYRADALPKRHSAFQYYYLTITPVQGLSWIKSIGNTISTNPYGNDLRIAFEQMRVKLEKVYGKYESLDFLMLDSIWNEPRDWMQAVQSGERTLAARWASKGPNQLPSNLESVFLFVTAIDTHSGYIGIEYEFNNLQASEQEIAMLEDDAL